LKGDFTSRLAILEELRLFPREPSGMNSASGTAPGHELLERCPDLRTHGAVEEILIRVIAAGRSGRNDRPMLNLLTNISTSVSDLLSAVDGSHCGRVATSLKPAFSNTARFSGQVGSEYASNRPVFGKLQRVQQFAGPVPEAWVTIGVHHPLRPSIACPSSTLPADNCAGPGIGKGHRTHGGCLLRELGPSGHVQRPFGGIPAVDLHRGRAQYAVPLGREQTGARIYCFQLTARLRSNRCEILPVKIGKSVPELQSVHLAAARLIRLLKPNLL